MVRGLFRHFQHHKIKQTDKSDVSSSSPGIRIPMRQQNMCVDWYAETEQDWISLEVKVVCSYKKYRLNQLFINGKNDIFLDS